MSTMWNSSEIVKELEKGKMTVIVMAIQMGTAPLILFRPPPWPIGAIQQTRPRLLSLKLTKTNLTVNTKTKTMANGDE
jgi:hypothetical protein